MTISGGFSVQATTIRVPCDVTDPETGSLLYDGLWVEVRRNLTNGERRALVEALDAIDQRSEALFEDRRLFTEAFQEALKAAEEDTDEQTRLTVDQIEKVNQFAAQVAEIGVERFYLIAPHIHRWNLVDLDTHEAIPAPRDNHEAALDAITPEIAAWLLRVTLQAYRMGFPIGSQKSGAQPEPTPEPSATKPKGSGSNSRRSRRTSSSPSPSA